MKFLCRDFPKVCFKRVWKAPIDGDKPGEVGKAGQVVDMSVISSLVLVHEAMNIFFFFL